MDSEMRTDAIAIDAEIKRRETLKDRLLALYPELADDDEALMDTLDGETITDEMIVQLAIKAKEREAAAKAVKELAATYTERARRHAAANESMKKTIVWALQRLGKKGVKSSLVSVSWRPLDDKIEIIDKEPEMAPDHLTKRREVVEYDMDAISDSLDEAVEMGIAIIHTDRTSVTIKV